MKNTKPRSARSLAATLAIAFFTLSVVILLTSGGLQLFFNIQAQQQAISSKQQLIAQNAAKTVANFIEQKFTRLELVELVNPALASVETQKTYLESLLGHHDLAFRRVTLLNSTGDQVSRASRLSTASSPQFDAQLKAEDMLARTKDGQRYISPIYIDSVTSEPLVVIAVPAKNALGDFQGTLVAEVNLKFIWDLVDQLQVGTTGYAYVVDNKGNLIAFGDTSRVLRGENVQQISKVKDFIQNPSASIDSNPEVGNYIGLLGKAVIGTYVPLGMPKWAVVTEIPTDEAYQPIVQQSVTVGITILTMAILAGVAGVFIARRLAVPLINLTETANHIARGSMDLQATVSGAQEIASLAAAFNSMTAQLRELIGSLEQRVEDRTKALARERNLLHTLIENLPDHIYAKDAEGRFTLGNIALARHMGAAKPDELIGKSDFDFYPPDLAARFHTDEQVLIQSGQPLLNHEESTQDAAGQPKWTLTTKVLLRDNLGKNIGLVGIGRDITERKQAETERERLLAELTRQQYILDTFMDNIPDRIYFKDTQSRMTRANKAFAIKIGVKDPSELIGKSDFDFYPVDQAEVKYQQEQEIIKTGQPILGLEEPDGMDHWALTTKMPLRDEKGIVVGTFGISSDITELVKAKQVVESRAYDLEQAYETLQKQQQILLIAEKMASLGRLTAGIAHEMNTPLAAVRAALANVEELVKEYQASIGDVSVTDEDHYEIAREIHSAAQLADKAAERAAGFVRGIKSQTRGLAAQENRPINAIIAVEDAFLLLNHALRQGKCELDFKKSNSEIGIVGVPGRLEQVVTNLVNNAIDASYPQGGAITVSLDKHSEFVELQVSDHGSGILPENLSKIFDPMFSTKPFGSSTGLGLTIVHDIVVEEFGGSIDVTSTPGQGATFTIHIPLEK